MRLATLLVISLCCILPVFAAEKEEEGDTVTVYKIKIPLQMPKEKPDGDAVASLEKNSKNKKMMEFRTAVQAALREIQTADGEPDVKKKKRAVEKALSKLDAAAKKFFREFEKLRKKPNDEYTALKKEKEKTDQDIEKAEEAGDDKKATKLAQSFDKKNAKYESLQKSLLAFNSLLYFEELPDIAKILDELKIEEKDLPDIIKIAETMKKDDEKDKDAKAEKKVKENKEDDKAEKKSKRKKSKKKDEEE